MKDIENNADDRKREKEKHAAGDSPTGKAFGYLQLNFVNDFLNDR